jgi:hypothetical protein
MGDLLALPTHLAMVVCAVIFAIFRAAATISAPCSAGAHASNAARQFGSPISSIRSNWLS